MFYKENTMKRYKDTNIKRKFHVIRNWNLINDSTKKSNQQKLHSSQTKQNHCIYLVKYRVQSV